MQYLRRHLKLFIRVFIPYFLVSVLYPTIGYSLSGGPSQPEVEQFAAAGVNNLVDPFSGDFSYNIPLLDVGGYPVNLSYQAGVSADQEASWVGLGFNVNPGSIMRNMRGLPDDFKFDNVDKEYNIKPNQTFGVTISPDLELLGKEAKKFAEMLAKNKTSVGPAFTLSYNTYKGVGLGLGLNLGLDMGKSNKSKFNMNMGISSLDGVSLDPSVSFSGKMDSKDKENTTSGRTSVGFGYNSRDGLKSLSVSASTSRTFKDVTKKPKNYSMSSNISFAGPTYVPSNEWPMVNINGNIEMKIGADIWGASTIVGGKVFYSGQMVNGKTRTIPAVGYMYAEHANSYTLMDFNREKDGAISNHTTNIAVPSQTQDLFSISGQGISGMFRTYRSDVGYVGDVSTGNFGAGGGVDGLEFGITTSTKAGLDISGNVSTSTVSRWDNDRGWNPAASHFNFNGGGINNEYEPSFFKLTGEKSADPESERLLNQKLGGYNPQRIRMGIPEGIGVSSNDLYSEYTGVTSNNNSPNRANRAKRNQQVQMLTADDASKVGMDRKIKTFDDYYLSSGQKGASYTAINEKDRTTYPAQGHHISQMTVNQSDGSRYIYGIPAYNTGQDEVTFTLPQDDKNGSRLNNLVDGITQYSSGNDDNVNNNKNGDHYFSKTHLPPFAHSYLLTNIVSADFVDMDGIPGPSDGDLGSYTKFNYRKQYDNYKWRAPYEENKATLSEGVRSNPKDDKGNYVYGTKEVWYLHSIETRTHIAEFYISKREDGYQVKGTQGGNSLQDPLMKLDKISLYAKSAKINNTDAEPIKEVHFDYDYSLCKNNPSNKNTIIGLKERSGKLTLKRVYFSFGKNKRNLLNPYEFFYADLNPDYHIKQVDRWGNYKPVSTAPSNSEFSFVEQGKDANGKFLADEMASAWNLVKIRTPAKGEIEVKYEADDYAYVQNKKAMCMMKVVKNGFFPTNDKILVNLPYAIPVGSGLSEDQIKQRLFGGIENLFFQYNLDCIGQPTSISNISKLDVYDYVPGYAKALSVNLIASAGNYTQAEITVDKVTLQEIPNISDAVNPVTKASMQYARLRIPEYVYQYPESPGDGLDALTSILGLAPNMITAISDIATGINVRLFAQYLAKGGTNGQMVDYDRSWIRLYHPTGFKKGGGHRVKEVTITDNWDNLGYGAKATYGQTYSYTTKEGTQVISSGVAAYEPMIGGEENPWRQPVFSEEKRKLAVNNEFYSEHPFGEGMFPGPSVGYSKVVVKDIIPDAISTRGTGRVEHEFYTAKDFPTIETQTGLDYKKYKPTQILKLLNVVSLEFAMATQGYYVENNDMHGKQKAQFVYPDKAADNGFISGVQYFYKQAGQTVNVSVNSQTDPDFDPTKPAPKRQIDITSLDNNVTVIDREKKTGKLIYNATLGVDHDFTIDTRESVSDNTTGGLNTNLDVLMIPTPIGLIPVPVPLPLPTFGYERTEFHSISTSKLVQRYGILENTVAYQQGAAVSTQNLAWDAMTGEVLLTKTTNNFDDPIYNFTYPAHWAYAGMGQAAENDKLTFTLTNNIVQHHIAEKLLEGDELLLDDSRLWVKKVDVNANKVTLMNIDGSEVTKSGNAMVIRSGHRNQQSMSVGAVVGLNNPLDRSGDRLVFDKVLQASANEYYDKWLQYCECYVDEDPSATKNEYALGLAGTFRPLKSYAHLTGRTQKLVNYNTNIRTDGIYTSFDPFWNKSDIDQYWLANKNKPWQFTTQVVNYNPMGFEIENKDALNRYSAAQYGFGASLPVAISDNSQYRESGFDSFEDYGSKTCWDRHFDFLSEPPQLLETQARTSTVAATPVVNNKPDPFFLFSFNYIRFFYIINHGIDIGPFPQPAAQASGISTSSVTESQVAPTRDLRASESHTGRQSIRVLPNEDVSMRRVIEVCPE